MDRNFKGIWIPKEIWESKNLSLIEKVLLVEIDSLDDENLGCWASNKYFANFFNLSNGRVSQLINILKEKNYIDIEYKYVGKEIDKRYIKIKRPPFPEVFNKLNRYLENDDEVFNKLNRGIKFSKGGYLENAKDNNIINNNIISNNIINNNSVNQKHDVAKSIIDYLNLKTNKNFKYTKNNISKIETRLKEFDKEDFKIVIDKKCNEWLKDNKMNCYLRPETLFGNKFESYLNQKVNKTLKDISLDEIEEAIKCQK